MLLKQARQGMLFGSFSYRYFNGFLHMTPTGLFDATTLTLSDDSRKKTGWSSTGLWADRPGLVFSRPFLPNHNRPTKCAVVILCGAWPATMASPLR